MPCPPSAPCAIGICRVGASLNDGRSQRIEIRCDSATVGCVSVANGRVGMGRKHRAIAGVGTTAKDVRERVVNEDGLTTAEYAVGTVAVAGLGGVLIQLLTSELDGDQISGFGGVHRCCFELDLTIHPPVPCTRTAMPLLRPSTVASSYDSHELLITTLSVLSIHHQR